MLPFIDGVNMPCTDQILHHPPPPKNVKWSTPKPFLGPTGTGTLGIPFAVSQGGYLALGAIVLAGWVTNYTGKLIIDCLYETSQQEECEELIPTQRRGVKSYAHLGGTGNRFLIIVIIK